MPQPMASDPILMAIVSIFIESAQRDSFNGVVAASLLRFQRDPDRLRAHLGVLVDKQKITCVFESAQVNMHIKRLPDLAIKEQINLLHTENLQDFCLYPTSDEIEKNVDITQWNDRPFSKSLALAEPQLGFRAFEMSVLERYTTDPRYTVEFSDYMGWMSIKDDSFRSQQFADRDKVSLQTFGLGFDAQRVPYVVVFLRYLSGLSPEHQQYWNSYMVNVDVRMCRQYYESSILGKFWKNRSVRYAITEEMKLINKLSEAIWGRRLFRGVTIGHVPIGLTSFLRPTADNFYRFVMALDKMLSDAIDVKFFDGKLSLHSEKQRLDGKVEIQRKGSITLLEEWLLSEIVWGDLDKFREIVISPLREVRRLRQKPAHTFTENAFSLEYYRIRRKLLWDVFNSLSNVRITFAKHPKVGDINIPAWLDADEIDVF